MGNKNRNELLVEVVDDSRVVDSIAYPVFLFILVGFAASWSDGFLFEV